MRWFELVLLCVVLSVTCAEPEPKKYKPEIKVKDKQSNESLTEEERKFLREVEEKFGIKSDVPVESNDNDEEVSESDKEGSDPAPDKPLFPAVIAIEIVNDTDAKTTNTKGKRTIDANLGYGYRTNNGYTYTYLGKPNQDKGKFMIYPYSQEDIPPTRFNAHSSGHTQTASETHTSHSKISPNVEITPSQAFELVPAKDEDSGYNYEKPAVEFKTKYENIKSVEAPPPPYPAPEKNSPQTHPSTLYTTYNGEQFSSLSGQFPTVMSNYLVDSSQLLKNPQYQSAGLTQDYLRTHGAQSQQRVVPVLVLRIPSSYIKNPSAELYADLPQNYPLSQYLKNVNLQQLVNQYFKKIGYPYAPQVMAYQNSALSTPVESPVHPPISNYEPQQYASPYVQPSYTHADHSGVQYSAVQPVMAKYPSSYRQQYYVTRAQAPYRQPVQHQQYVYRYRYVPQSAVQQMSYYVQPKYQQQSYQLPPIPNHQSHATLDQHTGVQNTAVNAEYAQQPLPSDEAHLTSVEYDVPHTADAQAYVHTQAVTSNYGGVTTVSPEYGAPNEVASLEHGLTKLSIPSYNLQTSHVQYGQPEQHETVSVYPRGQTGHKFNFESGVTQNYLYQQQINENSASDSLVLHENYPSKDHTIATVLPVSYKTRKQNLEPVQAVSYVTPLPHMKYQSQYRVMVPQTVFKSPTTSEKVLYVTSQSLPSSLNQVGSHREHNAEEEYTVGSHYIPPVGKQRPPSYPRNYHIHPKRMSKPEPKSDQVSSPSKKQTERSEKKKSSL